MAGPSTLPHDELAFCGCPLLRSQFWQCRYNSNGPHGLFHVIWTAWMSKCVPFLYFGRMIFKCTSNEKSCPHVFYIHIRLYWIDPWWELLSLRYFSHDALSTACLFEVIRVSQWGWDSVLARAALCSLTFRFCSLPIMCFWILHKATKMPPLKYGLLNGCSRKLELFSLLLIKDQYIPIRK